MQSPLTIRPATPTDARGIAEVHVRTWQDTYAGHMPAEFLAGLSVDQRAEMWSRVIGSTLAPVPPEAGDGPEWRPATCVWVAVDPLGQVFGFLCLVSPAGAPGAGDRTAGERSAEESSPEVPEESVPEESVPEVPVESLPEVRALYVSPGSQSRGAGGELLDTALATARGLGAAGVRLSVLEGNVRARRFYERHGFRVYATSVDRIAQEVEVPHAHYALFWSDEE
jgi:ribosomal protein S18 acetylase RimI-like enzyme